MVHYLVQRLGVAHNATIYTETTSVELLVMQELGAADIGQIRAQFDVMIPGHLFLFFRASQTLLGLMTAHPGPQGIGNNRVRNPPSEAAVFLCVAVFELNRPSIFHAGNVRSGSITRVATAIDEGAAAIYALHAVLSAH